jgi:hypothetical protein
MTFAQLDPSAKAPWTNTMFLTAFVAAPGDEEAVAIATVSAAANVAPTITALRPHEPKRVSGF